MPTAAVILRSCPHRAPQRYMSQWKGPRQSQRTYRYTGTGLLSRRSIHSEKVTDDEIATLARLHQHPLCLADLVRYVPPASHTAFAQANHV